VDARNETADNRARLAPAVVGRLPGRLPCARLVGRAFERRLLVPLGRFSWSDRVCAPMQIKANAVGPNWIGKTVVARLRRGTMNMRHLALAFVIGAVVAFLSAAHATAAGQEPSYLLLKAPARVHRGHAYYPGNAYVVRPHAYAYGWFGATPRLHMSRHTGHFSAYIQWSKN